MSSSVEFLQHDVYMWQPLTNSPAALLLLLLLLPLPLLLPLLLLLLPPAAPAVMSRYLFPAVSHTQLPRPFCTTMSCRKHKQPGSKHMQQKHLAG